MELETSVQDAASGIKSVRHTDRKKSAENLKEFLSRNAVPSLLSENTLKKRGYSWNNLFDDINEYVFIELEKYETSKTYENITKPLCSSLLYQCVTGSNKGKAYIKCEKITSACIEILREHRSVVAIGDTYLNLLLKHVLPYEHYVCNIKPSTWSDLLDVCVEACSSSDYKLDTFTKLRLLLLVMKGVKDNSQLTRPLMKTISSLEGIFSNILNDKKVQEVIIDILILLLETLSSEYRLTMCHFIESLMPLLLKSYDQNKDQKKKNSFFNLLNLTVVLHHPMGRTKKEEGSLANNWELWNKYLNSMTEIICTEVIHSQKNRKPNDRLGPCPHFYNLAASVHYQVFQTCEESTSSTESLAKRLKLSLNKNKTFGDLVNELQLNPVPWLEIIHMYVKMYAASVSPEDNLSLLNCLQTLLSNNANNIEWEAFEQLICLILKNYGVSSTNIDFKNTSVSLWNSCVRNCTSLNASHKALHTIMQSLLNTDILEHAQAQQLIILYLQNDMPVTNSSVKTLNNVFYKFYSKCSLDDFRIKCFLWLTSSESFINGAEVPELIFRIVADENIHFNCNCPVQSEFDMLQEIVYDSPEKCILFSEFEIQNKIKLPEPVAMYEHVGSISDVENQVHEYITTKLVSTNSKQLKNDADLLACTNLISIVLSYLDKVLKYKLKSQEEVENMRIYNLLVVTLTHMYGTLNRVLESNSQIPKKIKVVQEVKQLLATEFHPLLGSMLRANMNEDVFHAINNILNIEDQPNDYDIIIDDDGDDNNIDTLKHNCLLLLAAYCRKQAEYRDEVLKLILDENMYTFTNDTQCVLQCIELLIDSNVENPPLGLIFPLMQCMCRKLYSNSKVSYELLKILRKIMDPLCENDSDMKQNCLIMIKSYLMLCKDMHYPPKVAGMIYECAAKIILINRKQNSNIEEAFESAFMKKIKGSVHSIRIHCSYLMKLVNNFSEDDISIFLTNLLKIFFTSVAATEAETIIKDESANRTSTVLHAFVALAQSNKPVVLSVILQVIQLQKMKSLDNGIVKKALKEIVNSVGIKDIQTYLNNHIVPIVYFWFSQNNPLEDFPIHLLGFNTMDSFKEKHMKWLIAGEILWKQEGDVSKSDLLKQIAKKQKKTVKKMLEACFSNIMALCLPYIVSAKYKIEYHDRHKQDEFNKSMSNATTMFQITSDMLENERWSCLFVENVGELLLLAATHMSDSEDAEKLFHIQLPKRNQQYYYPKKILCAILEYFEHLTDGNVLQYLCQNQTVTVFQILFQLWKAVTQENIFELKILALHAYVTFIKYIPLGYPSDAFMCNFVCNGFTQVIKSCDSKNLMKAYINGLKLVLEHLLPITATLMRKSLLELLPILIIKKESGYEEECSVFLEHLVENMKDFLKESEDVVDFLGSMTQSGDGMHCANLTVFKEKLKSHRISLHRPSYDTLLHFHQFLNCNKGHIRDLYCDLDSKTLSEDCETSIIHQIVQSLCNILKSNYDDKTIVEACNCLSEITSYDLKTLVTVPPADTQLVRTVNPTRYFMQVVGKALLEVFFADDANITDEIAETMNDLLKFLGVDDIPDLERVDKDILKPFSSTNLRTIDTTTDSMKFEEYCQMCPDGVFLNVLLTKGDTGWLKDVTCTLLSFTHSSTEYLTNLAKVCALKPRVCCKILPALVGLILQSFTERHVRALGEHIRRFFSNVWDQTFDDKLENSSDNSFQSRTDGVVTQGYKTVVQYMLDIVDFVRIQRNYYGMKKGGASKTLNYLELNYNKIAWAAALVGQNWSAVYYGELWALFQNGGVTPNSPEATSSLAGGENLQRIFRTCYVSIGEIDAIEGCGTEHLTMENEKRKHLINSGQFTDALLLHDIALSCGAAPAADLHAGVVRSLHKSGMHHLALSYIKSMPETDHLYDVKYECLAFLGDWSNFVDTRELEEKQKQTNCNQNSVVKAFQYACLKSCLNIQNTPEFESKLLEPVNKAKLAASRLCLNLNMENCQNIYKVLEKLHIFNDIEEYILVRTNRLRVWELLQKWDVDKLPQYNDFKHIEALSSQRVLILEHAAKQHGNMLNEIVSLQIKYAKLALNNRRVHMAQRLLAVAKKSQQSKDITLVESEIAWAKGHKEIALSLLRNIVTDQTLNTKLAAISLRRYALWMADSKRDNPREIIQKYLKKSLDTLRGDNIDIRLKIYYDIAKFADAEYKQVLTYMKSSIYENRVKCLENMKGTALSLNNKSKTLTIEERRALSTNRKFKELDEAEIANTQVEKENFLQLAMRYYLLSLKQCDENNLSVFRVISLWLANQDFEFQDGGESFDDLLNMIPSWKFVTVLPQLAPRLTDEDTPFINCLKKIIKRCVIDHPHHTLPILFGLKNSDKDIVISNASGRISSGARARDSQPRVTAARTLVTELRTHSDELTAIITQMEKMCDAIISFANYKPSESRQLKKVKIPDAENIHKLRNLRAIPVPTVTLPIRKDCKYNYIHTLQSFDSHYELVGGVNCPKKINCLNSSGKNNVLLIKGGDDLKQDAVMQQVFSIVNTLLENNPVTNKNKLLIRTYKVVPMSRLSGVLEWCEGTIPMGLYLVGKDNSGAHARYRPQDISCDAARRKVIDSCRDSHEAKLNVLNRIMNEFKPVFQYFFTEHYLDPVTWYQSRLAYTKSVATSSMVGYILGLGDRHVYNILIDKRTAEVIHIDLGIAFDQGKTLPTPETVPFRLTRDIIAGFGSSGTEGIFRGCCEKTMQLLRDNQETLLTILEVLLCDPLYSWSVKTAQQNASTSNRNTSAVGDAGTPSGLAERALLVVTSKLSGTEDGVAGGVAVPGQVARLLRIATDPFNLCRLFHGWQAYL
ncbi:serine-protein kinase ATM [Helicoverpa armigera]|uniref:serine-protein kinase ATM n=1 Tax=Helicoverpa armigera TaxID=29058 RepID=UPI003083381F